MKIYILIVVLLCVIGFLAGVLKGQYDRAHYFDTYPSPLACHADKSCSVKK